jgi:flavodoxin
MKTLITYSSLTGNTKMVAEAMAAVAPETVITPISENPDPRDFHLIVVGFWVDRGLPEAKTKAYLEGLSDQKIAFFFTLGAYPDSEHAGEVVRATEAILERGRNEILGSWRCQGRVDPNLLRKMGETLPPDHPHARMSEERKARLEEAAKHPNEADCTKAQEFMRTVLLKSQTAEQTPF